MFLVGLVDKKRKIKVTNPGLVRSLDVIEKLKSKGIIKVTIDLDKSNIAVFDSKHYPTVKLSKEIHRAKRLLIETKEIVHQLLYAGCESHELDLQPINNVAKGLVGSINSNSDALLSLTSLRTKDAYLLEHSINVGVLLVAFGRHLGFSEQMLEKLMIGGIIHDIGKTKVDLSVLNKPAKLTDAEFEHMKQHQVLSLPLLKSINDLSPISMDVSTMHHEKLDGKGYPLGLKDDQISLVGRMSSIVDIYDALTARRVYKEGMSPAKAFKIMITLTPFHLDKDLLRKFMQKMGFYPVGSLIELSDGMAGLVWETNVDGDNSMPTVKLFYSSKYKAYRDVKFVDLAKSKLTITKGLSTSDFPKDIAPYREH